MREHMGFPVTKPEVLEEIFVWKKELRYPTSGQRVLGQTREETEVTVEQIVGWFPEIHPNFFSNLPVSELIFELPDATWTFTRKERSNG